VNIPENCKYSNDHEYVRVDGNAGIIGITDYAQSQLGDIIFFDCTKEVGSEVKQGEVIGSIEAVKTVAELFSPVSGKLIEVNAEVNNAPALVNEDPYGRGWLVKIEIADPSELNTLMDAASYKNYIESLSH
jgi:glycine cleavage system H protein